MHAIALDLAIREKNAESNSPGEELLDRDQQRTPE